jgi:hypothetical protein
MWQVRTPPYGSAGIGEDKSKLVTYPVDAE